MACEVKTFGVIRDFKKVQEYFGLAHDPSWLNSITCAISPTGELIALALGEKLALISSCWDNKSQGTSYALNWCGELENPNQIITSMICLPICGKGSCTGPEWTCVVLGLTSGMLLFYTDSGIKIFSQSYHADAVLCIKSFTPRRHSEADSLLYIVYDQCVCIIKGADILPLLTDLRKNINRILGASSHRAHTSGLEIADTTPYQKCIFNREMRGMMVNDAIVAGTQKPGNYDHIVEQCLECGYYARVAEFPTQRSLIVGVGIQPYLGFYYAEEGYRTISLSEVAKDVIGLAYKNLVGNLFRRTPTESSPLPPSDTNATNSMPGKEVYMRPRCRFYDDKRDGYSIVIAPGQRLAAITDYLDRVMLVDCERGTTLRMWKGYRDAQCGFVLVKERTLKAVQSTRRKALFLVIYAPRMGHLEIWALQNGPKVAAFNVSKCGQLAYSTHGLLDIQPGASKGKSLVNYCLFLDPSDGSVKEIIIPFHYALSESNSKTSRDIHQLKRLKILLRIEADSQNYDEMSALASEFQTIEVRQQCLEILMKNKHLKPKAFQVIVNAFASTLDVDCTEKIEETQNLKQLLENYKRLVDFYIMMTAPSAAELDESLRLSNSDLRVINQLVLLLGNKSGAFLQEGQTKAAGAGAKVTFEDNYTKDDDFIDYLNIFNVEMPNSIPLIRSKSGAFGDIGGKLFGVFFERGLCFTEFKQAAEQVKIPCEDLLLLVLHFWINKPFNYTSCDEAIVDMTRLAALIRAICELAGDRVNDYSYNTVSQWWQEVREILLESPKSLGLLVAIVCKTVAAQLRQSYREGSCEENSQTEDDEHWEQISHDEAQWGLLIGKLEDISVLSAILEYPIRSVDPVMPELPYAHPDCSLLAIVNGGKGIVSDLTAQWLINSCIHPSKIVESGVDKAVVTIGKEQTDPILNEKQPALASVETAATLTPLEPDPVLEKLALLRTHFPFSLESGMLLTLMSWQYMVHWSKNLQSLQYMRASITCLNEFKPSDFALKHGLCCMLWNAALKYPVQSTMKLIQKVGRLPGEKMCQQDIEMSASLVADFLELVEEFLQHFGTSLQHDKRELRFEESLAQGQLPLQFLALQQHHAISELLKLHTELCNVLHFIAFFQIKIPKPITSLFDAMSNKAFFSDINKELKFVLQAPDQVLQQQREDFLCKLITASMDLIREDLEQLYVLEHEDYMKRIHKLANSWKLQTTALKRQQVVEMYAHGYDAHAEALLRDILDDEHIGRMLLEIAGRRILLYSQSSSGLFFKVASVGPQLLQYLDNLKEAATKCIQITASEPDEIDIKALSVLIQNTFQYLSRRETKYSHIVAQMFDACCILQEV